MNWKQYEKEIYDHFMAQFPDAEITHDAKILGKYSKVERQIDILIEQYVAGNRMMIAVDGKYFNKKIDVKCVESFIAMCEDTGVHKGLLISRIGFSEAALNRAHFGPSEIELDILNFSDLYFFQGHGAIPFAGNNGALVPAPFGWVIDNQTTPAWLATMYQQGSSLDNAMRNSEFMYIQFWNREKGGHTLEDLLRIQENNFQNKDLNAKIEFLPTIKRNDARVMLRVANVSHYPTSEYTGFVEFDSFILFCVMFTPENRSRQNIKKLENILKAALPIKFKYEKS